MGLKSNNRKMPVLLLVLDEELKLTLRKIVVDPAVTGAPRSEGDDGMPHRGAMRMDLKSLSQKWVTLDAEQHRYCRNKFQLEMGSTSSATLQLYLYYKCRPNTDTSCRSNIQQTFESRSQISTHRNQAMQTKRQSMHPQMSNRTMSSNVIPYPSA